MIYFLFFNKHISINEEKSILHFLFQCLIKSTYSTSESEIEDSNTQTDSNASINKNKNSPAVIPLPETKDGEKSCYSSPRSSLKSETVNAHQISILIIDILGLTSFKRNEIDGSFGIFNKYPFHNKIEFQSFYSWYWSSKIAEVISPSRIVMKYRKLKGFKYNEGFILYIFKLYLLYI